MKLTSEQLASMGYTDLKDGTWGKMTKVSIGVGKGCEYDIVKPTKITPQSTAKTPVAHPVVQKVSEQPKSPEDRLNKTEREFLGCLRNGQYGTKDHIGIQSITLQLGFDCRYTPDFWTHTIRDGEVFFTFWEVKGFMRDDARVKLYAAARMFPFWTFVMAQKLKGKWETKVIDQ